MDTYEVCSDAVYSEAYDSYVVRYNNDLDIVEKLFSPCYLNIINSQYLVAYSRAGRDTEGYGSSYEYIPKCYGLMDTSVIDETGVYTISNIPGLALRGEGTLVGVIDTGIDYSMDMFRKRDGTSRIFRMWDQNMPEEGNEDGEPYLGRTPEIFLFGREYTTEDINEALSSENPYKLVPEKDENGHGTFLASVAAGGENEDQTFRGIAPDCELVVVKLKPARKRLRDFYLINDAAVCFGEDDIMLAVRYILQVLQDAGRPVSIFLGVGTNQGGHNGNSVLESYLTYLAGYRGVCICTPAGNELGRRSHFSGGRDGLEEMNQETMEIVVGENDKGFSMELWSRAPTLLGINILSPTGERHDSISFNRDNAVTYNFLYEGTSVFVENTVVERNTGDQLVFFKFERPSPGIWTIYVTELQGATGSGFDAWLPIEQFLNSDTGFVRSEPNTTITAPGNASGPITVAAYDHYNGSLFVNSGRGYTRDGRIVPDITAPGVNVYGGFAANRAGGPDLYIRRSGTSVATAVTAGICALLLEWGVTRENNVNMNTQDIRQMLVRGAAKPVQIDYPNRSWGWGVVDLYGAFEMIRFFS